MPGAGACKNGIQTTLHVGMIHLAGKLLRLQIYSRSTGSLQILSSQSEKLSDLSNWRAVLVLRRRVADLSIGIMQKQKIEETFRKFE